MAPGMTDGDKVGTTQTATMEVMMAMEEIMVGETGVKTTAIMEETMVGEEAAAEVPMARDHATTAGAAGTAPLAVSAMMAGEAAAVAAVVPTANRGIGVRTVRTATRLRTAARPRIAIPATTRGLTTAIARTIAAAAVAGTVRTGRALVEVYAGTALRITMLARPARRALAGTAGTTCPGRGSPAPRTMLAPLAEVEAGAAVATKEVETVGAGAPTGTAMGRAAPTRATRTTTITVGEVVVRIRATMMDGETSAAADRVQGMAVEPTTSLGRTRVRRRAPRKTPS